MSFSLPNPSTPENGQPLDASPVLANFLAVEAAIDSFDGSQLQAKSITEQALADAINPRLRGLDTLNNFVSSGCIWSATSGLSGAMTGGTIYVNGYRTIVNGVGSETFGASSDTYVDIDYLGNITYQSVSNNSASPSLTANSIRVAIIVTNGSGITLVNQAMTPQTTTIAPIVSNNSLWNFDTFGNQIYPTSPSGKLRLFQQRVVNATQAATGTPTAYNGAAGSYVFNAVAGRRYAFTLGEPAVGVSASTGVFDASFIFLIGGTEIGNLLPAWANNSYSQTVNGTVYWVAPSTGAFTLTLQFANTGNASGTWTYTGSTTTPAQLTVTEVA